MQYVLPFGITIKTIVTNHGLIGELVSSQLRKQIGKEASDAIESFLLAMACGGFDLNAPSITMALQDSIEAIANNN